MERWELRSRPVRRVRPGTALAILVALLPCAGLAQPGPGEVLRGLELRRAGEHPQALVRFRAPVRVLVRGARGPARVFVLPVEVIAPEADRTPGLPARGRRETARPPPGAAADLLEVSYEPRDAGPGLLEVRFRAPVLLDVAPGRDGRSVAVTWRQPGKPDARGRIPATPGEAAPPAAPSSPPTGTEDGPAGARPGPGAAELPRPPSRGGAIQPATPRAREAPSAAGADAPGWSVQVLAAKPGEEPPPPDRIRAHLPVELRHRLYLVRSGPPEGPRVLRYRVGPFATLAEARRVRGAVSSAFPDAWIAPERIPVPAPEPAAGSRSAAPTDPRPSPVPGGADRARAPAAALGGPVPPAPSAGAGSPGQEETTPRPSHLRAATGRPRKGDAERDDRDASVRPPPGPELVARARAALRDGRPDRAIPLLEGAVEAGDEEVRREARELLGVARERAGQLARARAEYELYLAEWPEGEASRRVRQRLEALLDRAAVLPPRLQPSEEGARIAGVDLSGSLYTGYRRETRRTQLTGRQVLDSSLYGDVQLRGAGGAGPLEVLAELSGSYLLDLGNRSDDVGRVRLLQVELALPGRGLAGTLGRQTGNRFGVTGRFDGLQLRARPSEGLELRAFGGFPSEPLVSNRVRTDRVFAGAGLGLRDIHPGLDLDLHAVEQWIDGRTDRRAVGAELRWSGDRLFARAFADWDLLFDRLNVLALHASLRAGDRTHLYLSADDRRLPELTLGNALLGTVFDDLGDLRRARPEADLESLARARTAHARTLRAGAGRSLGEHLHLTAELELFDLAGIASDRDVAGFDGTGLEVGGFAQLVATDLLGLGEVATLTASARDGDRFDLVLLLVDVRFRLGRRVRLVPLLLARQEHARLGADRRALEPGLRLDLQWGPLTGELEGRYRRVFGELVPGAGDETGFVLQAGVRYDF